MDTKNIDNLKTLLQGKDIQKAVQVGFGNGKQGLSSKGKKVGDTWEHNGKTWTKMENGTVTNITRFDDVRIPTFCPRCSGVIRGKSGTTAYYNNGTCLDCMVDDHNTMRKDGTLEQFTWKKRIKSSQSWLRDQEDQFQDFKENAKKNPEFIMSDGTRERWSSDINFDEIIDEYAESLDTYRRKLHNVIDEYYTKYNERIE